MKRRKIYKISIEDESRLESVASWSVTPLRIAALCFLFSLLIIISGCLFVWLTPAKYLMPGYFRKSERAMTEETLLKVDELNERNRINESFLANIRLVLDPKAEPSDSASAAARVAGVAPDSLMQASAEELNFVRRMQEREKFNISVQASLAAEGMLFYPVSEDGVQSAASRDSYKAVILLPANTSVMAMADGVVIAVFFDKEMGGYSLILQHDNGFTSRYSGLGTPLVGQGDIVEGGEMLSLSRTQSVKRAAEVIIELWHNGVPLKPFNYINHRI